MQTVDIEPVDTSDAAAKRARSATATPATTATRSAAPVSSTASATLVATNSAATADRPPSTSQETARLPVTAPAPEPAAAAADQSSAGGGQGIRGVLVGRRVPSRKVGRRMIVAAAVVMPIALFVGGIFLMYDGLKGNDSTVITARTPPPFQPAITVAKPTDNSVVGHDPFDEATAAADRLAQFLGGGLTVRVISVGADEYYIMLTSITDKQDCQLFSYIVGVTVDPVPVEDHGC